MNILEIIGFIFFITIFLTIWDEIKAKQRNKCKHNWEKHGYVLSIKKYYICTKCREEKTIYD